MSQKTLKQLLGASGSREQVDLNLDQATFRAPNVSAGQYSVQVQQTLRADQTQAGQLANALGRYAGPIARQYQGIEQQRQEEYAQVAGLLTPEQAKAVAAGDIELFREQFKQTADKLDSAQRKKFLKFVENPNNYIRASRVLGQKVASFVETDLIENKDKFIQSETDISTQIQEAIQTIASSEDYNLTGYALEGFMGKANAISERYTPSLIEAQDSYKEEQYIAKGIDSLAQTAKNGDFDSFVTEFTEIFNGNTPAEQAKHLSAAVSLVSSIDPLQAQALVGFIEDKLIFGNQAAVSEGLINDLNEQIEQQLVLENEFENRKKAALIQETNKNVANALLQIQNGDPLEPFSVKLFDGEDLEVNTDGVTSTKDLYDRLAKTVYSSEMASDADKAVYSTQFLLEANKISLKEETRYTSLGVDSSLKEVTKALEANIAGVNMFDLDAVGIQEQADEFNEQLREGIDAIYNDPSLNDGQKANRSASFIRQQTAERLRDLEARVTEEKMTQFVDNAVSEARLKPNQAFVNGLERDILESISLGFTPEADQIEFAKNQAKSLVEPIREEALSILQAPFTQKEKENISQAWIDRQAKVEELKDSVSYKTALDLYNKQQEEKSQQEEKRKQEKTIVEKLFGAQESNRYRFNYDGDVDDSPNGYQKDGILFHPNGQNYRGKYPTGILYEKGVMENSKYRKLADQLDTFRTKLVEQIEGTRRVILSDPKDQRLTISYTGEKYMEALYGQRTVINGEPAITADEIRAGMLEGKIPFDTTKIRLDVLPILSPEMINNPDEYEDIILDYASALNVPKEQIGSFLFKQARALSSRGIIFKTNTNTKKED